jgi:hypothetical protein
MLKVSFIIQRERFAQYTTLDSKIIAYSKERDELSIWDYKNY